MDENLTNDLSLGGNLWQVATVDERLVEILVQKYNLPYIVAKIMVLRGVGIEEVADFLNPKISNMMPDPYVLKDVEKAMMKNGFIPCSRSKALKAYPKYFMQQHPEMTYTYRSEA